jgi:hypothetical protein
MTFAVRPVQDADRDAVRRVSGRAFRRGALVYCQTFWTQDCVGLRDPRLAAVEAGTSVTWTSPAS